MIMKVYKLTTQDMTTHGDCRWVRGKTKETSGEGGLCGPGWLHWYSDPLLAVIHNPVHADIQNPRLFAARASGKVKRDSAMKSGSTRLTLTREIPLPVVSTESRA